MEIKGIEAQARPLPLLVLADTSGSMSGAKISSLNQSLAALVQDLRVDEQTKDSVMLSVISFDDSVSEVVSLQPVSKVSLPTLATRGQTCMGEAMRTALRQLSDPARIPARCLTPVILLASDGQPTDHWQGPLNDLQSHAKVGGALRLALAIGRDADTKVLSAFASVEYPVLQADNPEKIKSFFKWATWVTKTVYKSGGRNRNQQPPPDDLIF